MKKELILPFILIAQFLFTCLAFGQIETSVRFKEIPSTDLNKQCFQIEVSLQKGNDVVLGSQSYRFYYDASHMRFLRTDVRSLLNEFQYSDVKVLQVVHNSNANGFGNLEFSPNLGFVNMVVTNGDSFENLVSIHKKEWVSTVQCCFEMQDTSDPVNIVWARKGVTDGYATAYTAIAISKNGESLISEIVNFEDLQESVLGQNVKMAISNNKN